MRDDALVELPESITLDLSEAADVLGALDEAIGLADPDSVGHHEILRAIRLLTRKLWPELGDLLEEDDG